MKRGIAAAAGPGIRWAIGNASLARGFGDAAVPTLFLFGRDGRVVQTFSGAPPGLHERIEKVIAGLAPR